MHTSIYLKEAELSFIRTTLKDFVPNARVVAYGSRINGNAKIYSDLDMAIFAKKEQEMAIANLKEHFEESDLPFKIDLFVWDEIPSDFQENILQKHFVLQEENQ